MLKLLNLSSQNLFRIESKQTDEYSYNMSQNWPLFMTCSMSEVCVLGCRISMIIGEEES